jgi:uncharacterized protein DUF929
MSRTARQAAARARAAEMRAAQARAERRARTVRAAAVIGVVLAVVAVLVIAKVAGVGGGSGGGATSTAASQQVVKAVTAVPPATLDKVGAGTVQRVPRRIDAPALTAGGKPRFLYVGAEYCPFCAAERWPVVVALSRFGTWSRLGATHSSGSDVYPNTATLSFHGVTFTSSYLSFTGVETRSNKVEGGSYAPLDSLSPTDQKIFETYDRPPYTEGSPGGIPFLDIGGPYVTSGASYDPKTLQGKSHEQIAGALADPNDPVAQAVDGTANVLAATVCQITGGKPAAVCDSAGVRAAAAKLGAQ